MVPPTLQRGIQPVPGDVEALPVQHVPLGRSHPPGDGCAQDVLDRVILGAERSRSRAEHSPAQDRAGDTAQADSLEHATTIELHVSSSGRPLRQQAGMGHHRGATR